MPAVTKSIRTFLSAETGAISVDYVVLAAGATGLTLASAALLTGGMGIFSDNVESELRGEPPVKYAGIKYSTGFDNGSDDWQGVSAQKINGIGNVLGPIAGSGGSPAISRLFKVDPAADKVTFNFDLLAMDSLDNESGIIFLNGSEVGRLTRNWSSGFSFTAAAGVDPKKIQIMQTTVADDVQLGGHEGWKDHTSHISLVVNDPDSEIEFGFGSTANQSVNDESFSIDNFVATGLLDSARI